MHEWKRYAVAAFAGLMLAGCTSGLSGQSSNGYRLIGEAASFVSSTPGQLKISAPDAGWSCTSVRGLTFGADDETVPLRCTDRRTGQVRVVVTGPSQANLFLELSDGEKGQLSLDANLGQALYAATGGVSRTQSLQPNSNLGAGAIASQSGGVPSGGSLGLGGRAGCTKKQLDDEMAPYWQAANARRPATGIGSITKWQYQTFTEAKRRIIDQQKRCPNIDLRFAIGEMDKLIDNAVQRASQIGVKL